MAKYLSPPTSWNMCGTGRGLVWTLLRGGGTLLLHPSLVWTQNLRCFLSKHQNRVSVTAFCVFHCIQRVKAWITQKRRRGRQSCRNLRPFYERKVMLSRKSNPLNQNLQFQIWESLIKRLFCKGVVAFDKLLKFCCFIWKRWCWHKGCVEFQSNSIHPYITNDWSLMADKYWSN